jgi:hypothetical protein
LSVPNWLIDGLRKQSKNKSKRNCNTSRTSSCFERVEAI